MRAVRRADTGPELILRKLLHAHGYRFRLHRRDLPGTPDIVLPRRKVTIFVHGCFWHGHERCSKATTPKMRVPFWTEKFERNVARDRRNEGLLRDLGWTVLVIWECEIRSPHTLLTRLVEELPKPQNVVSTGRRRTDRSLDLHVPVVTEEAPKTILQPGWDRSTLGSCENGHRLLGRR